MGDTTAISWADHTFNPWEGCTRISPACDNCYAADRAHRFGNDRLWAGELRRTSPANWHKPLAWNRVAQAAGRRARVFCASLADVFDNQAPPEWREDLWRLIEATPNLTWMLLTKRPQNVLRSLSPRWLSIESDFPTIAPPPNVELGFTAEDQVRFDQRFGWAFGAASSTGWPLFISAEPLLGQLDLEGAIDKLALVIAGGESGPKARPSHLDWFRALRDQCGAAGVPFHFKQWGEWTPTETNPTAGYESRVRKNGFAYAWPDGSITEWRERACAHGGAGWRLRRVGTACAGRLLDGVEHLAMPEVA